MSSSLPLRAPSGAPDSEPPAAAPGLLDKEAVAVASQTPAAAARKGTRSYLIASGVAQFCALIRYTLLARLLGPEQLGLAATLILTAQFFDSISDSGSDRFLIQDRDGDSPGVQRFVQLVFVSRGVFSAVALVAFSHLIAAFYKTPALASGLMVLAASPFIFGFLHLDMRRAQRHHDFRTESMGLLVGESLGLVATIAAAWFRRDFTAVLYGLIVRSVALVVVSHVMAERPYKLGYSPATAPRLARFAAPLMLNGLLLFAGSQGDRVLVANQLGLAELGRYSAVLLLIFYPSGIITRYLAAVHLPSIAAGRDSPPRRDRAVEILAGQTLLLALAMTAGFSLVGPLAVRVLYGAKFTQTALIISLIGILQSVRFLRLWPNTVALALGRSGIVLTNNVARLVGLPTAIAFVATVGGLAGLVGGLIAGEIIAMITAIVLLNRAQQRSWLHEFDRVTIYSLTSMVLIGWAVWAPRHPALWGLALAAATLTVAGWTVVRERVTIRRGAETFLRLIRRV